MAEPTANDLTSIIAAETHGTQQSEPQVLSADVQIVLLTWFTFFLLLVVLHKIAWKPILSSLEAREEKIRRSLDDARKAQEELERIEQMRAAKIKEADNQAREIVEFSRKAATEAAKTIDRKAREEAHILLNNAQHEINAQAEKARVTLREESVAAAVNLASRILEEELDDKKHHKLIDKLIKNFHPDESKEQ